MTVMGHMAVALVAGLCLWQSHFAVAISYFLDRQSTCGQTLVVYDSPMTLGARSNVAPANPPLECIVKLQSAYQQSDGRYRLQIIVEQLQIEDCTVFLTLFNGWGVSGNYLQKLGCGSSSTNIIYTKGREATVLFQRPLTLHQTGYAVTLTVQTYADADDIDTIDSVKKLPIGAIIGIVCGIIAIIALAILLCWCVKSGYLYSFIDGKGYAGNVSRKKPQYAAGSVDSGLEKESTTSSTTALKNGINYQDPGVWSSITTDGSRQFRRGVPRRASGRGAGTDDDLKVEMRRPGMQGSAVNYENYGRGGPGRNYANAGPAGQGRDSHVYEPYDNDRDESPRFRKRKDDIGASNRSRGSRRSRNSAAEAGGGAKETMIDDPGTGDESVDEKKGRGSGVFEDPDSDGPVDHKGEADVDTITSPIHVNAGVRASIPDLSAEPNADGQHSPRTKKRGSTSPKSRKKNKGGVDPDPMALPPEAFDPVFTTPTSQEQYPGEFNPLQPPAMPAMFAPYGMFPVAGMVPGAQTYAYAYQSVPPYGAYPGQPVEGAYYVQSVPTADGDMQNTAFMMHKSKTPQRKGSKGKGGVGGSGFGPGSPDFTSTPGGSPRPGRVSDMSVVAAGAAPPDPGSGHRSMAMKSYADPDTGVQTTQVLWTDNVPDPTDPKPGDSSQVTRKTMTRVTTKSGHGDFPTQTSTLLDYPDQDPAFLTPSRPHRPVHPAAITPNTTNIDYYMGEGQAPVREPEVVHEAPSRSSKFKDRITLHDSHA